MKTYKCLLSLVFVCSAFIGVFAQGASNKGTDFWLMYGAHVAGFSSNQNNWQDMAIYVTSDVNTTGILEIPGINYSVSFSVSANTVTAISIPKAAYIGGTQGKFNKGIHLKSLKPIVAYAHIYDSSVSGATLVLPTNTLGKEYYSLNFTQKSNSLNAYSFCSIVAVEDNTQVVITPSVPTQGGWAAGVAQTITLNRGEVYQVLGLENSRRDLTPNANSRSWYTTGGDLTGTTIKSVASSAGECKKIAVFSGSSKMSIGCLNNSGAPGSADNIFQQVYPTATWGKSFVTVPSKNRNYDIYRIFKSSPTAVVKLNGNIIPNADFVNNFYYEFSSQQTNYIESDNTIQVVQYQVTQGKSINCAAITGDVGDPEMIFLNPLEQTLNKMTMFSSQYYNILRHYINVVIRTNDVSGFTLDGISSASEFKAVPNKSGYSYAQIEVGSGTHNLQANGGFNAIAYGFGQNESYGYAAGASLISPGIEALNTVTNLKQEIGCLGEAYNLSVSLPYEPLSISLDLDDGQGIRPIALNLAEAFVSNNITYYKYKLIDNEVFNDVKQYNIKVSVEKPIADGCGAVDILELAYDVLNKPTALFDVVGDKVCNGVATRFNDRSTAGINNIVKWHWDYGDGNKEVKTSAATFTKTYSPGIYNVKLFVENQAGCLSEAFSKTVSVYEDPVPKFVVKTPLCAGQAISFENQSTSVNGGITVLWDFGDGTTSTDDSPSHTYANVGEYDVTLKVTSEYGCEKTVLKRIKVNPVPIVEFDLPNFCLADGNAIFVNKTTITGNEQLTYLWDFGDIYANAQRPNTSTQRNGAHVYTRTGLYEVKLTVQSASGCAITISKEFTVNGSIPKAIMEVVNQNSLCSNAPVVFKDKATVDFGEITKIEWFFDYANKTTPDIIDNQPNLRTATAKEYSFKYPTFNNLASKTYVVKMKVYSGGACTNEETRSITIYPEAIVDFVIRSSCLIDGKASFDNLTTYNVANANLTYLWNFGDQNANVQNPNSTTDKIPFHRYTHAGRYNVSLTVTTPFGCSKTLVKEITVDGALPIADFSVRNANALCSRSPVIFEDKASLAFGNITRIDWYYDFANNPNAVETDNSPGSRNGPKFYSHEYPTFSFPFTKHYVVKMVAYSGSICLSEVQKTITLKALPDIEFAPSLSICREAPEKQLIGREKNAMPGIGVFSGSGITATGLFNPARAGVGVHTIKYTFTINDGCAVEKIQLITVNETPTVDAGEDKLVLEGGQVTLSATSYGQNLRFKWSPSVGLDRDDVLNPIVRPTEDMTYVLTVTSGDNCVQIDQVNVKLLRNLEIPNAITPNGDFINDEWHIKYIESYPTAMVEIYDRAGQNVFKSKGYTTPFNGTYNNNPLPMGTYYYVINLATGKKPITGVLTIIR